MKRTEPFDYERATYIALDLLLLVMAMISLARRVQAREFDAFFWLIAISAIVISHLVVRKIANWNSSKEDDE